MLQKIRSKKFNNDLSAKPWEELRKSNDVNKIVELANKFINETFEENVPLKK